MDSIELDEIFSISIVTPFFQLPLSFISICPFFWLSPHTYILKQIRTHARTHARTHTHTLSLSLSPSFLSALFLLSFSSPPPSLSNYILPLVYFRNTQLSNQVDALKIDMIHARRDHLLEVSCVSCFVL